MTSRIPIQTTEDPELTHSEEERRALLVRFAARFMEPETPAVDWDLLREGKPGAWPLSPMA
jgi:hypothetical protein